MQSDFFLDTQTSGRTVTLTLTGELDMVSSPMLDRALQALPGPDLDLIIIDLRRLEFMDSTGLHLLVEAQQQAHEAGRRFVVVRGGDQVQRLFDLSGVTEVLTVVASPDQLLEVDPATGAP